MTREELIKRLGAYFNVIHKNACYPDATDFEREAAGMTLLTVIESAIPGLSDLLAGKAGIVPAEALKWWRELVDLNPQDLAPRLDARIAAVRALPTPDPVLPEDVAEVVKDLLSHLEFHDSSGGAWHETPEVCERAAALATRQAQENARLRAIVANYLRMLGEDKDFIGLRGGPSLNEKARAASPYGGKHE